MLSGLIHWGGACCQHAAGVLERDAFFPDRHPALSFCWSTIFSEKRHPPRIKRGAGFFRIMLREHHSL
jgi:hypothetical protein